MGKLKAWWQRRKRWQKILTVVGGVLVAMVVLGSVVSEEENQPNGHVAQTESTPTVEASPTPTPKSPSPPPPKAPPPKSKSVEEKIDAAVKEMCPTAKDLEQAGAINPAACTDVTGYDLTGGTLQVKTTLYPKDENKEYADEIAGFTLTAIGCGDKVGAKWDTMDVLASDGQFLVDGFRPPRCQ